MPAVEVSQVAVGRIRDRPEHDPLKHPQHVHRAQHDAGHGNDAEQRTGLEHSEQNQELAHKAVETGQAN